MRITKKERALWVFLVAAMSSIAYHAMQSMSTPPRWNLQDLFQDIDDPLIDAALAKAKDEAVSLTATYKGRLAELSAQELCDVLARYERIIQLADKPENFAFLSHSADMEDTRLEVVYGAMRERVLVIEQELVWVKSELGALGEERFQKLYESGEIARYRYAIEVLREKRRYQLPDQQERLLMDLQQTGREAFRHLFEQEDALMRVSIRGEERSLESVLRDREDADRSVRREAMEAVGSGLEKEAQRRAFMYTSLIKNKQVTDRYRGYAYPEQERHQANGLSSDIVEAVMRVVEDSREVFQRYYAWKAKMLHVDKVADHDLYAPVGDVARRYSFQEAHDLILEAFRACSPKMADLAQECFDGGWIDAEPRKEKRGGAYCQYVGADLHPYVSLHFEGSMSDVLTLAHELGHAVHTMLARPVGELQFVPSLALAETASTFSEMLVFDTLRKKTLNPRDRQVLQAKKIEELFSTVFRQVQMYRFEQSAHQSVLAKGFATPEDYQSLWIRSVESLVGGVVVLSPWQKHEWSRISHFFDQEFYVYAYPFGELLTCLLYQERAIRPDFEQRYLALLEAGGSKRPTEALAFLGLDLADVRTWRRGLSWIETLVDETVQEN